MGIKTKISTHQPAPAKTVGEFFRHDSDTCPCKVCAHFRADYPPREPDPPKPEESCEECGSTCRITAGKHNLVCYHCWLEECLKKAEAKAAENFRCFEQMEEAYRAAQAEIESLRAETGRKAD